MDELTFSNHSSNGTTSTDKRNSKNLIQLPPHAGDEKLGAARCHSLPMPISAFLRAIYQLIST